MRRGSLVGLSFVLVQSEPLYRLLVVLSGPSKQVLTYHLERRHGCIRYEISLKYYLKLTLALKYNNIYPVSYYVFLFLLSLSLVFLSSSLFSLLIFTFLALPD